MGLTDIPDSYQAFETWNCEFERTQFRFAESSRRVHALNAFGFPRPLPLTRPLLRASLALRGRTVRWLPPRRSPRFFTDNRNRTHPEGYSISTLGPPRLVAAEKRREHVEAP